MCYPSSAYLNKDEDNYWYATKEQCEVAEVAEKHGKLKKEIEDKQNVEGKYIVEIDDKKIDLNTHSLQCWSSIEFKKYNMNSSMMFITFGLAKIQNLVEIGEPGEKSDSITIVTNSLFSGIILIAYIFSMAALFVALIVRVIFLWIFVGFSPFIVLLLYLKNSGMHDGEADLGEGIKFGLNDFLKWAYVPVKIGAIFAVSFIMISAGQILGKTGGLTRIENTYDVNGALSEPIILTGSAFGGLDSWEQVLWLIMTTVVMWVGVFSVAGDLPIVGKITNAVNDKMKTGLTLLGKAPYLAPIVPLHDKAGNKTGEMTTLKKMWQKSDPIRGLNKIYKDAEEDTIYEKEMRNNGDKYKKEKNIHAQIKIAAKGNNWKELKADNYKKLRTLLGSHLGHSTSDIDNAINQWQNNSKAKAAEKAKKESEAKTAAEKAKKEAEAKTAAEKAKKEAEAKKK